jgi:hypothetical protein
MGTGDSNTGVMEPQGLDATLSTPQSVGDTTVGSADRERVAQRAYELYLQRGGGEGQAMDDWLAAERELADRGDDR